MVTEEALPSYLGMLGRLDEAGDETGASPGPFATWNRAWAAEENRHGEKTCLPLPLPLSLPLPLPPSCPPQPTPTPTAGDLLNKYLYLTGRVDMGAVERTIQHLIGAGLDPGLENNPYLCFVYTSFQARGGRGVGRG